jgi:hypothetical protein
MDSGNIIRYQKHLWQSTSQLEEELSGIEYAIKKQLPLLPSTYEQTSQQIVAFTKLLAEISEEIDRLYHTQNARLFSPGSDKVYILNE